MMCNGKEICIKRNHANYQNLLSMQEELRKTRYSVLTAQRRQKYYERK
jgi:hypothetical protein